MDSTIFLLHFGSIVGSEETTTTCNNHGCTTGAKEHDHMQICRLATILTCKKGKFS
uniref:Uncharacterized protein n=1 Tax=Arundo donax TaxID=35708 RepID=A0A0A9GGG7_ARUDO